MTGFPQSLSFDHITIDDGLSNNTIYAITKDQDGVMWFGSRDGLNRYDGYAFKVYKSDFNDTTSIGSNNIQELFCHSNGDIWIGLVRGGLYIFERATQQFIANPFRSHIFDDWNAVSIVSIFQDSKKNIWLGTLDAGIVKLDSTLKQFTYLGTQVENDRYRISNNTCFSFAEDSRSNIWMGTSGNFINYWNPTEQKVYQIGNSSKDAIVVNLFSYRKKLFIESDQYLWVGSEGNGLYKYDLSQSHFVQKSLDNSLIRDIARYDDHSILISTDGEGLFQTMDKGATFRQYTTSNIITNSINTNALYDIFIDQLNNTWIGSFNGGVNLYLPQRAAFLTYLNHNASAGKGYQSILAFCESQQGELWLGTDGNGMLHFNPATQQFTTYQSDNQQINRISSNVITTIEEGANGELWIGTFTQGFNRFDPVTQRFTPYKNEPSVPSSLTNNNVWDIEEDQFGNLWIGTLGGGLDYFDRTTNTFTHYLHNPQIQGSLSGWNVQVLLIDSKNNLWVGMEYGGLNKLEAGSDQFEHWEKQEKDSLSLRSNSILAIKEDRNGQIWIGTEGGGLHLLSADEQTFKNYSLQDGLPSMVINSIEEDQHGYLWLSTNLGLSRFDPENITFVNFDKNDGLQSNQFNPRASLNSRSGQLYFGGIDGFNVFTPDSIHVNNNPPEIVFTDFLLFNESVPIGLYQGREILTQPLNDEPTITLQYSDNVFTIQFAIVEYTNSSKNLAAYQLEGFDEGWNYVPAQHRTATYTNLDAGTYTFLLKGANNSGVWSDEIKQLHITILPPFWETWWFRLLLVLLSIGLVFLYIAYLDNKRKEAHQKQLMKAEQEILRLKNEKLGKEIDQKNAQLSAALLQSAHKNNTLDDLKRQLSDQSLQGPGHQQQRHELRRLIRKIDAEIKSVDYWEQFQLNFDQIHQQFSKKIHDLHPQLTANDIRLCCLIKINMTNREIASIQNISVPGIEKSKYRLKKKLQLPKSADLNQYILSIS